MPFVDDPQMINVAVSRAIQRFILVTNYDMLPTSRHIRDLVGYIRYHNPGDEVIDSAVVSVFDLLYQRVLAAAATARCPAEEGTQVQVRRHHLDRAARHHR